MPDPRLWSPQEPLILTPERNYTAHEYKEFFDDINFVDAILSRIPSHTYRAPYEFVYYSQCKSIHFLLSDISVPSKLNVYMWRIDMHLPFINDYYAMESSALDLEVL
ncbi:unnamed protein product [Protopolystoma xenopodis]|uniref:Uncharacterized protein n=1 Tax=Protopolystoma xenopodis TaxID=117903 RepID=A0A3S5B887_9PLAT|nr:unnamed protein product [Protopolystoma xenopodis]